MAKSLVSCFFLTHGVVAMALCLRLSQVGVLSKRLNEWGWFWRGSFFPHVLHCIIRKFMYLLKGHFIWHFAPGFGLIAEIVKLCLQHDFVARVS